MYQRVFTTNTTLGKSQASALPFNDVSRRFHDQKEKIVRRQIVVRRGKGEWARRDITLCKSQEGALPFNDVSRRFHDELSINMAHAIAPAAQTLIAQRFLPLRFS